MKKHEIVISLILTLLSSCGDGRTSKRLDLYLNIGDGLNDSSNVKYVRFNFDFQPYIEVPVEQYEKEFASLLRRNVLYYQGYLFSGYPDYPKNYNNRIDFRPVSSDEKPAFNYSIFSLFTMPYDFIGKGKNYLSLDYAGSTELDYFKPTDCPFYNLYMDYYEEKNCNLIRRAVSAFRHYPEDFVGYGDINYVFFCDPIYSENAKHLMMITKQSEEQHDVRIDYWKENVTISGHIFEIKDGKEYLFFLYDEKENTSIDLKDYSTENIVSETMLDKAIEAVESL